MTTAASTPSLYRRTQRRIYEIMDGAVVDKFSHFVDSPLGGGQRDWHHLGVGT